MKLRFPDRIAISALKCIPGIILTIAVFSSAASAQKLDSPIVLETGKPIDRDIAPGQTHQYFINLTKGQFVRVLAEQRTIDVKAALLTADDHDLFRVNAGTVPAIEPLSYLAERDQTLKIQITPAQSATRAGSYRLVAELKSSPSAADLEWMTANKLLADAAAKREKITKESLLSALDDLRHALTIWKKLGDRYWETYVLFQIGRAYFQAFDNLTVEEGGVEFYAEPKNPFILADDFLNESLTQYREAKDSHFEATVLFWLGKLHLAAEVNEKAIEYYEQALPIYQRVGNRDREGSTLLGLGAAYERVGNSPKSADYDERAAVVMKEIGSLRSEIEALNNAGIALGNGVTPEKPDNFDKALDYFNRSLEASKAVGDREFEARAFGRLAWLYSRLGNNKQKVLELYSQALAIRRELKDRDDEAGEINSIGETYAKFKDYSKALNHFTQALEMFRAEKDRDKEAEVLENTGDVYFNLRDYEKALDSLNQAIVIRNELNQLQNVAEVEKKLHTAYDALDDQAAPGAFGIEPGRIFEKSIAGRAAHTYQITLNAGEFSRITLEQRGIDVLIKLYGPDNRKLFERDSPNGRTVQESLSFVAAATGSYRIVVRTWDGMKASGGYSITVEAPRALTSQDKTRIAAEVALAEAQQLKALRNPDAYARAVVKYEEAAKLFEEIHDPYWQALSLTAIAQYSEFQKRLEYEMRAANLYQEARRPLEQARALFDIGVIYNPATSPLGSHTKSIEFAQQALDLYRALGDRRSEMEVLGFMGYAYLGAGENSKAIDALNQTISIARKLKDENAEYTANSNLASIYEAIGEDDKALGYYEQNLAISHARHYLIGERATLRAITIVKAKQGKASDAELLQVMKEGLVDVRQNRDFYNMVVTMNSVGRVTSKLGQKQKALEYFEESLAFNRDQYQMSEFIGESLFNIGITYKELGEREKALDYFEQTRKLVHESANASVEAASLYNLALIERDRNNSAAARAQIEAAIKIVESLRANLNSQEMRASYFATVRDYYELYIELLMRLHKEHPSEGHDREALQASERGRARSLIETLTEAGANIREGVDATLLERERALRQRLNARARELMQMPHTPETDEQAKGIKQDIAAVTNELEELGNEIKKGSPRYANLIQPEPLTTAEIQKQVLDDQTVLLEYSLGEERSYLWAVTPSSITSYELPKRTEIEALARDVYELISKQGNWDALDSLRAADFAGEKSETSSPNRRIGLGAGSSGPAPDAAIRLSQILFAPIASSLTNKRLVIVADGALQYIPFAALPSPTASSANTGYHPLIVDHEVISLPSASTLSVLRQEVKDRKPAPKAVAVLADPVFASNDERVNRSLQRKPANGKSVQPTRELPLGLERAARESGVRSAGDQIARLPGTRDEAKQIMKLGAAQSKLALDFSANRQTATSDELAQYRYLHFASHGFLDASHPELSGIVLSLVDEQGNAQDGFLRAHEVFNLKLPAELVVLSACQTGLGKEIKGEGLVGLTRAFMYAGSPRVVVSLWSVNDRSTAELMARFYRRMLVNRMPPAAALRAAQVSMLKEPRWQSPFYWAAFTLQGEWR